MYNRERMTTILGSLRKFFSRQAETSARTGGLVDAASRTRRAQLEMDLPPDDALVDYLQQNPAAVQVERIKLESPALDKLKAAGVKLIVPLVSQGELIGMLNLGSRLSEQEYSGDDIALLNNLAAQATPAVRVAQLVRQQKAVAQERERIEQELQVARLIQQTLLPKELPEPPGWHLEAYYQPARAVGGDFYDFIQLPDERLGIFVGDVTDKGFPAALVMATTRRILRFSAEMFDSPGQVLEHANNLLVQDIPANMFVTCLYAVLDVRAGLIRYANAGHNPPYSCTNGQVEELRATGMPLGLMPEMRYEEKEAVLADGGCVLFYSDGLVEAHDSQREMFSFGRVKNIMGAQQSGEVLITKMLDELKTFTGSGWEQEDDVTLLTLERKSSVQGAEKSRREKLAAFEVPSQLGNERSARETVAKAVAGLGLETSRLERVKTAVAEAVMNAMEHGNHFDAGLLVHIEVWADERKLSVLVTDHGGNQPIPTQTRPDLEAKLAGLQSPRGWGLFLIENMVDEMRVTSDETHHTLELIFDLKGGQA
jgi:serine phosphatase RsbU (regulator of sigma subunit)/anti-sigma regulatory factor (Ser/Thr protein kinase)